MFLQFLFKNKYKFSDKNFVQYKINEYIVGVNNFIYYSQNSFFMKINKLNSILAVALATFISFSCQKKEEIVQDSQPIAESTLSQIKAMGFSTHNASRIDGGYLVEGDIMLRESDLGNAQESQFLRVGVEEQYRTTNLVGGLPRQITIGVSSRLPSSYVTAVDEAIRRYNVQGLRISFRRVSSGSNIFIGRAPSGAQYLASAGFPSGGNPYNQVLINANSFGSNPNLNTLASVVAHELGHCIGFRHTDYMNRSYSCGGQPVNEGASTVGAVLIPGTPSGPDPNSWMLACIGSGQNRPFNSNDVTALNFLY